LCYESYDKVSLTLPDWEYSKKTYVNLKVDFFVLGITPPAIHTRLPELNPYAHDYPLPLQDMKKIKLLELHCENTMMRGILWSQALRGGERGKGRKERKEGVRKGRKFETLPSVPEIHFFPSFAFMKDLVFYF